jgi:hypothetical protein
MKTITWIISVVLLVGMFFSGFFYAKAKYKPHILPALPQTIPTSMQVKPTSIYKDSAGYSHFVYNPSQITVTKKEAIRQLSPFIDSVAAALNVKSKQIESSAIIETVAKADSVPFYKKQVDSLKRLVFFYKDKNLKLTVRTGNPTDTLDTGNFDFSYDADLKINQYWKRKKVLGLNIGSKQHFTDISSNDPRATIGSLKTFTIKQNLPSVGFRMGAQVNYNFATNTFSPGIGFRFDANRFSLNGIYYYNTQHNDWRPVLSLRYDVIQF